MTQTVLITGAGGFIGAALAAAQLAAGHAVLATDLSFDPGTRDRLGAAQLIEGSLPEVLAELSGVTADVVIHAAAITADPMRFGLSRAGHICANTSLLLSALDWARGNGVGRFVFLSSSGVFGVTRGYQSVDERAQPVATDPYSAAKRAGEILLAGASEPEFETVTLRLGPVFGPFEGARATRPMPSLVARMIEAVQEGRAITVASPDARRDWTFLPDIARAVGILLENPGALPSLLHLTSGTALSDLELAQAVASHFPGTHILTAPDTSANPPRPIMVSGIPSPLGGFQWTPFAMALATMLSAKAPA